MKQPPDLVRAPAVHASWRRSRMILSMPRPTSLPAATQRTLPSEAWLLPTSLAWTRSTRLTLLGRTPLLARAASPRPAADLAPAPARSRSPALALALAQEAHLTTARLWIRKLSIQESASSAAGARPAWTRSRRRPTLAQRRGATRLCAPKSPAMH